MALQALPKSCVSAHFLAIVHDCISAKVRNHSWTAWILAVKPVSGSPDSPVGQTAAALTRYCSGSNCMSQIGAVC